MALLLGALLPLTLCSQVPAPEDVRVQALNTNYTLHWSWDPHQDPHRDREPVSFTVQYMSTFRKQRPRWRGACETPELFCDLNPLDLHYLGIYSLQVRASVRALHSRWTGLDFAPAKDAGVGPPSVVKASAAGDALEVCVTEPRTVHNTSMREKISSLHFRLVLWEKQNPERRRSVDSRKTLLVVDDLSPWTWYCVSVQSRTTEPDKTSAFSDPVCVRSGGPDWQRVCLHFAASLGGAFLLVLGTALGGFHGHRVLKSSFHPSVALPECLRRLQLPPDLLPVTPELQCDLLPVTPELQCDLLPVTSELQCDLLPITPELQCDLLPVTPELQCDLLPVTPELQCDLLTFTPELQCDLLPVTSELLLLLDAPAELLPVTPELLLLLDGPAELLPVAPELQCELLPVTSELQCELLGLSSSSLVGDSGCGVDDSGVDGSSSGCGVGDSGVDSSSSGCGVDDSGVDSSSSGCGVDDSGVDSSSSGCGVGDSGVDSSCSGCGVGDSGVDSSCSGCGVGGAEVPSEVDEGFGDSVCS